MKIHNILKLPLLILMRKPKSVKTYISSADKVVESCRQSEGYTYEFFLER